MSSKYIQLVSIYFQHIYQKIKIFSNFNKEFIKPEVSAVYEFLRSSNALLVHFSGTPPGTGKDRGKLYPHDLKFATEHQETHRGLACSVVKPGDNFHGYENRNATGTVGIILGLKSRDSLVGVSHTDMGSSEDNNGSRDIPNERDIRIQDLEKTLGKERTTYNEWVVRNYVVLGIFAAQPCEVSAFITVSGPHDPDFLWEPTLGSKTIPICEVCKTFQSYKIYSFGSDCIVRIIDNPGKTDTCDHTEIYKC